MTVAYRSFRVLADVWFSRRFSRIPVFHSPRPELGPTAAADRDGRTSSSAIATVRGQSRVSGLGATASEDGVHSAQPALHHRWRFDPCGARPDGPDKQRDWLTPHGVAHKPAIACSSNATAETVDG